MIYLLSFFLLFVLSSDSTTVSPVELYSESHLRLPSIISDHMVLQRNEEVAIWGWAAANEEVSVRIGGQNLKATATEDGRWSVELNPLKSGKTYEMQVSGTTTTLEVNDILVGETWIASGQSNMEWTVQQSDNAGEEISNANFPQIRQFKVALHTADTPQDDCKGQWVICSPETAAEFSAAGYFFAREIHQKQQVPVGLINSTWGGTPAEAWTKRETLASDPRLSSLLERMESRQKNSQADRDVFAEQIKSFSHNEQTGLDAIDGTWDYVAAGQYQLMFKISSKDGQPFVDMGGLSPEPAIDLSFESGILKWTFSAPAISPAPFNAEIKMNAGTLVGTYKSGEMIVPVQGMKRNPDDPVPILIPMAPQYRGSTLYNAMINPIAPYTIRGAIWYQGESNVNNHENYHALFSAMINDWRVLWDQRNFPFYFVQIAPFNYGEGDASAYLREAQMKTLTVENTGMVVTTDIATIDDIHPTNKQDVGTRLAKIALARIYEHEDKVYSGPLYQSMDVDGKYVRLHFKHIGSGLMMKGDKLTHFTIADEDENFVQASAKIDGNTVLVWSDQMRHPKAVRFGWSNVAEPNLFNKEGLPASPFRTDDW